NYNPTADDRELLHRDRFREEEEASAWQFRWQQEVLARLERIERGQALTVVKEAYTTEEAAERLGRSEWTVRQWCNKGQVQGARKGLGKGRTGEWRLSHEAATTLQTK